jgi:hypothetical protein
MEIAIIILTIFGIIAIWPLMTATRNIGINKVEDLEKEVNQNIRNNNLKRAKKRNKMKDELDGLGDIISESDLDKLLAGKLKTKSAA